MEYVIIYIFCYMEVCPNQPLILAEEDLTEETRRVYLSGGRKPALKTWCVSELLGCPVGSQDQWLVNGS